MIRTITLCVCYGVDTREGLVYSDPIRFQTSGLWRWGRYHSDQIRSWKKGFEVCRHHLSIFFSDWQIGLGCPCGWIRRRLAIFQIDEFAFRPGDRRSLCGIRYRGLLQNDLLYPYLSRRYSIGYSSRRSSLLITRFQRSASSAKLQVSPPCSPTRHTSKQLQST